MLEWLCDVQRNKIFTITFHSKVTRKAETAPRRVLSGFGNAKEPYTFCAEIQQILHIGAISNKLLHNRGAWGGL